MKIYETFVSIYDPEVGMRCNALHMMVASKAQYNVQPIIKTWYKNNVNKHMSDKTTIAITSPEEIGEDENLIVEQVMKYEALDVNSMKRINRLIEKIKNAERVKK